jgi:hypothetical protein
MKTDGELRKLALALTNLPDDEMEERLYEVGADLSENELTRLEIAIGELASLYASFVREKGVELRAPADDATSAWMVRCLACGHEWPTEPRIDGANVEWPEGWHYCPKGCNSEK